MLELNGDVFVEIKVVLRIADMANQNLLEKAVGFLASLLHTAQFLGTILTDLMIVTELNCSGLSATGEFANILLHVSLSLPQILERR